MRDIIVADADTTELRDALDAAGLEDVDVSVPDGEGQITVSVPDDVDGVRVDLLLQAYAAGRTRARLAAVSDFIGAFGALDINSAATLEELKTLLSPIVAVAAGVPPFPQD